jgi:hypothetical protein
MRQRLNLKRFTASIFAGVVLALTLAIPAGTAAGETFQQGDLVVATQTGFKWLRGDGTLVKSLPIGFTNQNGAQFWRAAFNPSGTQMWATTGTDESDNKVIAYDNQGNLLGAVIDPFDEQRGCGAPADISFDAKGFAYIGMWTDCEGGAKKFTPEGDLVGTVVAGESDWVDIASDQCTLYWQNQNEQFMNDTNVCTGGSTPFFRSCFDSDEWQGMRILPDGSVLSVEPPDILRSSGTTSTDCGDQLQSYSAPSCPGGGWTGLQLNVGGTAFWSSCFTGVGLFPHEIDVATGQVLHTLNAQGLVAAVYGGFRAGLSGTTPPPPTFDFSGFFPPVDNPPTVNVMPAGKAVQVIFSLHGNQGLDIFAPGSPIVTAIPCPGSADKDKVEVTTNANSSHLSYNAQLNLYVYTWATSPTWRGTCRDLDLQLKDGSHHHALFRLN